MFLAALLLLALVPAAMAQKFQQQQAQQDQTLVMLKTMSGYFDIAERFLQMSGEKEAAVFLATEGIIEIYEKHGRKAEAAPHLLKIIDKHKDSRVLQNVLRFKLRDSYNDTGQTDLAMEQLEIIIEQNR